MMDEQNIYDYLDGKLSGDSLKEFESQLKLDKSLQREVATIREMKSFLIEDVNEENAVQSMKSFHESFIKENAPIDDRTEQNDISLEDNNHKVDRSRRKLYFLIPASIAALFLVGFFLKPLFQTQKAYAPHEIFAAHFNPASPSFAQKGGDDTKVLLLAENAFNNKDFKTAITHFTTYLNTNSANYEAVLYRAISYISEGEMESARTDLNLIRSNRLFEPAANLYDALIHIKEMKNDQAKPLLQQIPKTSSFYKEAQSILKKL